MGITKAAPGSAREESPQGASLGSRGAEPGLSHPTRSGPSPRVDPAPGAALPWSPAGGERDPLAPGVPGATCGCPSELTVERRPVGQVVRNSLWLWKPHENGNCISLTEIKCVFLGAGP